MAQLEAGDITQAVIDRMADCTDERFKKVMTALVKHAHAFLREVEPTEAEWIGAIEFLTATGKKCDDKRQEFILLSDTLGISMLVVALNQAQGRARADDGGAPLPTEATVQGPFYWDGAPELRARRRHRRRHAGRAGLLLAGGSPTRAAGPVANCVMDVWSGDGDGIYDMQLGDEAGMRLRARFRTDADGRYRFWSIRPTFYPVPDDGPVGDDAAQDGPAPEPAGPHPHEGVRAGPQCG